MLKNTKLLLIIGICILGVIALYINKPNTSLTDTTSSSTSVFSCELNGTTAQVMAEGEQLTFVMGDLSIKANPDNDNIAYYHEMWMHAEDKQLRFRQGDDSYVLFNRWASPNYEGEGALDYSGLLILKGYDQIDLQFCLNSSEFSPDYDFTTLPNDGENIIPEQASTADTVMDNIDNLDALNDEDVIAGAYRDEHNCIPSAGYEWSEKKQKCIRPWLEKDDGDIQGESNQEETTQADDSIRDIGLIKSIEDGPYPMFSVTVEFPKRQFTETFSLNIESMAIDQNDLYATLDQYVTFDYTSELVPRLYEMTFNDKSLLDGGIDPTLKKITGILSGAASITKSDLPGLVTVTDQTGKQVHIPHYVSPAMVEANGKEVTAYYYLRTENNIVHIPKP